MEENRAYKIIHINERGGVVVFVSPRHVAFFYDIGEEENDCLKITMTTGHEFLFRVAEAEGAFLLNALRS